MFISQMMWQQSLKAQPEKVQSCTRPCFSEHSKDQVVHEPVYSEWQQRWVCFNRCPSQWQNLQTRPCSDCPVLIHTTPLMSHDISNTLAARPSAAQPRLSGLRVLHILLPQVNKQVNCPIHEGKKIREWCSSVPLPPNFQSRHHGPSLSLTLFFTNPCPIQGIGMGCAHLWQHLT